MLGNHLRTTFAAALILGLSTLAVAQYNGGGMAAGPNYNPNRSYGSTGAIIGGAVGGAALIGGLLYWKHHHKATLEGCVAGEGDKLVAEKGSRTYKLANMQGDALKPGQHLELLGKKTKGDLGEDTFQVFKINKDLGTCSQTLAAQR